ncbi:MAG: hypothetical protein QOH87_1594 [Trebonia sp.]|jgi:hypothetical protein|nr:hypothetical protein [Trebonia sp.]
MGGRIQTTIDPTQSGSTITSITSEAVMDNVTLVRKSVTGPARGNGNSQ